MMPPWLLFCISEENEDVGFYNGLESALSLKLKVGTNVWPLQGSQSEKTIANANTYSCYWGNRNQEKTKSGSGGEDRKQESLAAGKRESSFVLQY